MAPTTTSGGDQTIADTQLKTVNCDYRLQNGNMSKQTNASVMTTRINDFGPR